MSNRDDNSGMEGLDFVHHSGDNVNESSLSPSSSSPNNNTSQAHFDFISILKYSKWEKLIYSFVFDTYHDFYNHHNK
jgi:hypothetical protein